MRRYLKIGALLLAGVAGPQLFRVIGKTWSPSVDIPLGVEIVGSVVIAVVVVLIVPALLNGVVFKDIETIRRERMISGQKLLLDDTRPYFLYLRAFDTDNTRPGRSLLYRFTLGVMTPENTTYEETVVKTIGFGFGPVVAIGEPGTEVLPPLGAGRMWFDDDVWQDEVRAMFEQAQAVVFVLGATIPPGLAWELEHAFAQATTPVLLVLSPSLVGQEVRQKALDAALRLRSGAVAQAVGLQDAAVTVIQGDARPRQYADKWITWPFDPLERPVERALDDLGLRA